MNQLKKSKKKFCNVSIGSINIDFLKRSLPGFECQAINKSTLWIGCTIYNQYDCQFEFYDRVLYMTMQQHRTEFDQFCNTVMKIITEAAEQGLQRVKVEITNGMTVSRPNYQTYWQDLL